MTDELPSELRPEDLPDDPDVLKRLVCDLYETVRAHEELVQTQGAVGENRTDLGWLTRHLGPGGPAGHDPED